MYKFVALGALYNKDNPIFFEECLKSIKDQTIKIPIYIIIDGPICSDLRKVLTSYESLNIKFFQNEKNLGLAKSLQKAILQLKGSFDYVLRFDADDINLSERFEITQNFVFEHNPDLVSGHMYEINEKSEIFSQRKVPIKYKNFIKYICFRTPINHPASCFNLNSVIEAGGYEEMPFFEDWFLWSKMVNKGYKIRNIDEYLVKFRATDSMIRRRFGLNYMKNERNFFLARHRKKLVDRKKNFMAYILRTISKFFGFRIYKEFFYLIRKN